jgi:putative flavoprotein involved in K+ transport
VLKRRRLEPVVLERGDAVATSWRNRYEGLRLNTLGWMSGQPGYRATKRRYGQFPTRERWIDYLEDYARHHGIEPRFGVEAQRIDRDGEGWRVETNEGSLMAPVVVVATGFDHEPYVPDWDGRARFAGELLHASRFRNAEPFRGKDVLVIGPNITGTEIATFLANGGAARVRVSMRTPPNIFPRKWLGIPLAVTAVGLHRLPNRLIDAALVGLQRLIWGDLSKYGLPRAPRGVLTNLLDHHMGPAIDAGFVDAVKAGRIELLANVERFDGASVVLVDGQRIQPEVVIAATGYRRGLDPLVGHLDVLDAEGIPLVRGGKQVPSAPGLFFCGYFSTLAGQMRDMRFEARAIGRAVRRMDVRARAGTASPAATLTR